MDRYNSRAKGHPLSWGYLLVHFYITWVLTSLSVWREASCPLHSHDSVPGFCSSPLAMLVKQPCSRGALEPCT